MKKFLKQNGSDIIAIAAWLVLVAAIYIFGSCVSKAQENKDDHIVIDTTTVTIIERNE